MANRLSESEQKELYERIANMMVMEVQNKDIARAVGLDETRISQIKNDQLFQEIYGSLVAERIENDRDINDGLDAIEKQAISSVLGYMQRVQNPDYALKALAVVNKSQRRGSPSINNRPINAEVGKTITIHLQQNFVQAVQNQGIDARPIAIDATQKKHEEVLPPAQVEHILNLPRVKNISDDMVVELARITGKLDGPVEAQEAAFVDL